jgi:hypothetical protein
MAKPTNEFQGGELGTKIESVEENMPSASRDSHRSHEKKTSAEIAKYVGISSD